MFRLFVLAWCALGSAAVADPAPAPRALLYPAEATGRLKDPTDAVRDRTRPAVPYADLAPTTEYYARVAPRRVILDDTNQLRPGAVLGTKPFVFLTSPQALTGKSLLDVLLDVGHEPADLLADLRDKKKDTRVVALVFKYPPAVGASAARDGKLADDWGRTVYVPTWDNVSAVFGRLAAAAAIDPAAAGGFQPDRLALKSEAERAFAMSYPAAGLARLKRTRTVPYDALRRTGGADWEYRLLLKEKLNVFAHFRGNGRTANVLRDPDLQDPGCGVFEYLGPNSRLADLPELAVVDLGRLTLAEGD